MKKALLNLPEPDAGKEWRTTPSGKNFMAPIEPKEPTSPLQVKAQRAIKMSQRAVSVTLKSSKGQLDNPGDLGMAHRVAQTAWNDVAKMHSKGSPGYEHATSLAAGHGETAEFAYKNMKKSTGEKMEEGIDSQSKIKSTHRANADTCPACSRQVDLMDGNANPPRRGPVSEPAHTCAELGDNMNNTAQRESAIEKAFLSGVRKAMPERIVVPYKVASVSDSANSFGLRGHILLAQNGHAVEIGLNSHNSKPKGSIINIPMDNGKPAWHAIGAEIPKDLGMAPPPVIKEVWGSAVKKSHDDDSHECIHCGGPSVIMGRLGQRVHGRCRNCGGQQSWVEPDDQSDDSDDETSADWQPTPETMRTARRAFPDANFGKSAIEQAFLKGMDGEMPPHLRRYKQAAIDELAPGERAGKPKPSKASLMRYKPSEAEKVEGDFPGIHKEYGLEVRKSQGLSKAARAAKQRILKGVAA